MRTFVTESPPCDPGPAALHRDRVCARVTTRAREPRAFCCQTHSGQRNPTGAAIMHS